MGMPLSALNYTKMKKILLCLFVCSNALLVAQDKRDYQWIFGKTSPTPDIDGTLLNFNTSPVSVTTMLKHTDIDVTNTSMCSKSGELLFYSTGCQIFNAQHQLLANGDSIASGYVLNDFCNDDSPLPQGALILPLPGSDSIYYHFNLDLESAYTSQQGFPLAPLHLFYSIVSYREGAGNGAVTIKKSVAVADTLTRGGIQAVKHGNGRDWWVIVPKSQSNCYHRLLLSPSGLSDAGIQCLGWEWSDADAQGQCTFSPDGKKYLRIASQDGLLIYDFDRCSGSLSAPVEVLFPDEEFYFAGVAVSPNNRFVYATTRNRAYQFDLFASNVQDSRVLIAEKDSFMDPFQNRFFLAQLAPDGKIYIGGSGTYNYLHIIHSPDSLGAACEMQKHAVPLISWSYSGMPTFPNFRLYDWSGSVCDTIGISTSLEIGKQAINFSVYPNPAKDQININLQSGDTAEKFTFELFDSYGRSCLQLHLSGGYSVINIENIENGTYFYVLSGARSASNGKIVKIE